MYQTKGYVWFLLLFQLSILLGLCLKFGKKKKRSSFRDFKLCESIFYHPNCVEYSPVAKHGFGL